jgi:hypothetical protein
LLALDNDPEWDELATDQALPVLVDVAMEEEGVD